MFKSAKFLKLLPFILATGACAPRAAVKPDAPPPREAPKPVYSDADRIIDTLRQELGHLKMDNQSMRVEFEKMEERVRLSLKNCLCAN
jgi:hypothetical protein